VDPLPVRLHRRQIGGHLVAHRQFPGAIGPGDLHLLDHPLDEQPERHGLDLQRNVSRLQAGQVEQLIDEPGQALRLLQHDLQERGIGLLHAVEQVLQMGPERRDRRLQLVGHVGHQLAPEPLQALHLPGHPVEGPGKLADLVTRAHRDARPVFTAGHAPGRLGHVAEGLGHPPGQDARQEQGDERGDGAGQQELPPHAPDEPRRPGDRPGRSASLQTVGEIDRADHAPSPQDRNAQVFDPPLGPRVDRAVQCPAGRGGDLEIAGQPLPRVIDHHHRMGERSDDPFERSRRSARRSERHRRHHLGLAEELTKLPIPVRPAQGETDRDVHDQDGHGHGEDDHRAELGPDGGQLVQGPHGHQASRASWAIARPSS
jgi:hypothetical protein